MADPKNLLAAGTALAMLGRVPASIDDLWARVHRREGPIVRASGIAVRRAGEAIDRLGLATIACDGVKRAAAAQKPLEIARLRYHVVALLEGAARSVAASRAMLIELTGDAPEGRAALAQHRVAIARIQRLAADAARPHGPSIAPDPAARGLPALHLDEPSLSAEGVGAPTASRREWQPIGEVADRVIGDAIGFLEDAARAIIAFVDRGGAVELDLRVEEKKS
jgi:hypothetical protein